MISCPEYVPRPTEIRYQARRMKIRFGTKGSLKPWRIRRVEITISVGRDWSFVESDRVSQIFECISFRCSLADDTRLRVFGNEPTVALADGDIVRRRGTRIRTHGTLSVDEHHRPCAAPKR